MAAGINIFEDCTNSNLYGKRKFNELRRTNIGAFEVVKDLLAANDNLTALNKLNAMVNWNRIDANNTFMGILVAINYDPSGDDDADTLQRVIDISSEHPFYGGEAVYMARAMLHIDVPDELPLLRMAPSQNLTADIAITADKFHPFQIPFLRQR